MERSKPKRAAAAIQTIRCDAYNDDPLRVARVAKRMPARERIKAAAERLAAAGHEVRATILAALSIESLCVCELSALIGMSSPALMHHLRILGGAGVIEVHKEGKFAVYHLADQSAYDALAAALRDKTPFGVT